MIGKYFSPDRYAASTFVIDFSKEYSSGIRGVIFDIDNTLVPHGAPADERAVAFAGHLKSTGLKMCLLSNNHEERVKPFAEEIGADYVFDAHKPSGKNYYKAMELMGTDLDSTLFIGDQLLTDVFGAKRIGMKHILVKPVDPETEPVHIKFKRLFEKMVLKKRKPEITG